MRISWAPVINVFAVAIASLLTTAESSAPRAVQNALRLVPRARLLAEADFDSAELLAEVKDAHYWPRWLIQDLDGDGQADIALVVTRNSKSGREYGVLAVHAREPRSVHWVVPFSDRFINGVTKGYSTNKGQPTPLMPLFCVDCDANSWARWSGRNYEWELYSLDEEFRIRENSNDAVRMFGAPSLNSRSVSAKVCVDVTVRRVGGKPGDRWYYVATTKAPRVAGWIPSEFIADHPGDCDLLVK